jgi:two-component system cell cycle response regulator
MEQPHLMRSEATIEFEFNPDADRPLPAALRDDHPPCRVLVVDDDELVRAQLANLLIAARYEVELAASGAEALRVLSSTRCDIVLTDWQMPRMDGLALCRLVRMRAPDHYLHLIMLTIRDTNDDILTGLAAGADDYLVKGASVEEFLARLEIGRRISRTRASSNPPGRSIHADAATDVHSLGYLVQHLPRELARSQRYGHSLAVVTCNIQGFDRIRSSFERETGEDLLREFVRGCADSIRKSDWVARTGPGEFMVVLPETKVQGAHCVARKFRTLFTAAALSSARYTPTFTAHIAVTAVEAKIDTTSAPQIQALLRAAIDRSQDGSKPGQERAVAEGASMFDEVDAGHGESNELH